MFATVSHSRLVCLLVETSQNGLEVAKAGHRSEGRMGMMADSCDSERLRGGGIVALWLMGIMANRLRYGQ